MGAIKVKNSETGKVESKDLNTEAKLTETRKQLGTLMEKEAVFLDKEGKPVPELKEKDTNLKDIEKDSAITIDDDDGEDAPDDGADPTQGIENPDNKAPFGKPHLEPKRIPPAVWADDHVGLEDGLVDGKPVKGDKISQMKVGQVRNLLKANRINLNRTKFGIAPGFVDTNDKGINWAAKDAVRCAQVEVKEPASTSITGISFQYSEHTSRLHRATTTEGDASVGIPLIFSGEGSFRIDRATRTDKRMIREHKSFNYLIPKAHVLFDDKKISLTKNFVADIKKAVGKDKESDRAPALLKVLDDYGQFFATDMLLGGRLNYWTEKTLKDIHDETADQETFRLAVKARATVEGVPVEGGGGSGTGVVNEEVRKLAEQAGSFHHRMQGGNEAVQSPAKWIPTVAKYLNWKPVGFNKLVPTFDYLKDETLRSKCIKILRDYFTRNLQFQQTIKAGATHGKAFGGDVGDVKRIVQIKVRHGINVDGLQVTYELMNGRLKEMPLVGGQKRHEKEDIVGPLAFDEEIESIETATAPYDGRPEFLRRLAFKTTKGRRFPESGNEYFGRGGEGDKLDYTTIEAPRVCGIVGNSGNLVDSIGLRYRDLAKDTKSRDFLLEIEPYLFPSNLPDPIEMTLKGVLVAGKWRKADELINAPRDGMRNTLIVELGGHSTEGGPEFWPLADTRLVGFGAIVVCLLRTGVKDRSWLKAHSTAQHRDALIEFIHDATEEPLEALRRLDDAELVRWGSSIRGVG